MMITSATRLHPSSPVNSHPEENSAGAELRVVQGGKHFLSAGNPGDVNPAVAGFSNRWK